MTAAVCAPRRHCALNAIQPGRQDWVEVVNSPLSEAATLGFEYGFSLGCQVLPQNGGGKCDGSTVCTWCNLQQQAGDRCTVRCVVGGVVWTFICDVFVCRGGC